MLHCHFPIHSAAALFQFDPMMPNFLSVEFEMVDVIIYRENQVSPFGTNNANIINHKSLFITLSESIRLSSVIIKCAVSPARSRTPASPSGSGQPSSKRQEIGAATNSANTVFVGGLAEGTKCTELHKHFSSVGKVKRCKTVRDHHTNKFLGYGFVTMETEEEAELCIKYLNDSIIGGQVITVKKAKRSFAGREQKRIRRRQKRDYYSRYPRRRRFHSPYEKRKRVDDYSSSSPDKKRKRVDEYSSSSPDQKRKRVDEYSSSSPDKKRKRKRTDEYSSSSPDQKRKRVDEYSSSSPDQKRKRVDEYSSSSPDQKRKRVDEYSSSCPYEKRKRVDDYSYSSERRRVR